jgi:hypothetical protein
MVLPFCDDLLPYTGDQQDCIQSPIYDSDDSFRQIISALACSGIACLREWQLSFGKRGGNAPKETTN